MNKNGQPDLIAGLPAFESTRSEAQAQVGGRP